MNKKHGVVVLLIVVFLLASGFQAVNPNARPEEFGRTWQTNLILPEFSTRAKQLLAVGIAAGHDPHAFSKVGDCDTSTTWYLSDFDQDNRYYNLGQYADELAPVLAYYKGSFSRRPPTAKPGFSAASVLSNYWNDFSICGADEVPLTCEYRIHNPLFVLISLGTNDGYNPPVFKENLRAILDETLKQKRLPILMLKADNVEGNFSINQDIADLAKEYELPIWNFWGAIQDLPSHGLVEDGIHLTFYKNDFADSASYQYAWTYRNLTALQLLERVMKISEEILEK